MKSIWDLKEITIKTLDGRRIKNVRCHIKQRYIQVNG